MDYRAMDRKAEELRAAGAAIADKGEGITNEERDSLLKITGQLEELDRLRVEARDAELDEARRIADAGSTPGGPSVEDRSVAAYRDFLRSGIEDRTAIQAMNDGAGGYVVPEPVHGPLIEKYRRVSPLLENTTVFQMTGDTTLYLPRKDAHGVVANAPETGSRSEQTEPTFTNGVLQAWDYYTDQRVTQQFLDSVDGAEDLILNWIYGDFAEQFQADLATGNGSGQKPQGIFTASSTYATTLSGSAGALTNTSFLTTFFALPQKYRANTKWYMSPATLSVALGFAFPNLNNTPLVETRADGFYILGKRVVEVDDAPAIGASNFPVAFGDLAQAYAVGIHKQASILRDPYTATPLIRFYGLGRMGGTPWNKDALRLLKSNNA